MKLCIFGLLLLLNRCATFLPPELSEESSGDVLLPVDSCHGDGCRDSTVGVAISTSASASAAPSTAAAMTPKSTDAEDAESTEWPCDACYNYSSATASYWGNTDETKLPCSGYSSVKSDTKPAGWYRLGAALGDGRNGGIAMEWCAPMEYCTKGYRLWTDPATLRAHRRRSSSLTCEAEAGVLCLSPPNELYRNRCSQPLRGVTVLTCREPLSDPWQVYRLPAERICSSSYCFREPGDSIPPRPNRMCDQLQERWENFRKTQLVIQAKDVNQILEKNAASVLFKQLRADYFSRGTIELVESVIRNAILKAIAEQAEITPSKPSAPSRVGSIHRTLDSPFVSDEAGGRLDNDKRMKLFDIRLVNLIEVARVVDENGAVLSGSDYETRLMNDIVNLDREQLQMTFVVLVDSPTNSPLFIRDYKVPRNLLTAAEFGDWYLLNMSAVQQAMVKRVKTTLMTASVAIVSWSPNLPSDMLRQVQFIRNATRNAAASDPWAAVRVHLNFFIAVAVVLGICSLATLTLYVCYRVQRYRQDKRSNRARLTSPSMRSEVSVPADTAAKINDTVAVICPHELPSAIESPITASTVNLVKSEPTRKEKPKPAERKKDKARKAVSNGETNQALDAGDIVPVSEQRFGRYAEVEVHRQDLQYQNGAYLGPDFADQNDQSYGGAAQDLSAVTRL